MHGKVDRWVVKCESWVAWESEVDGRLSDIDGCGATLNKGGAQLS